MRKQKQSLREVLCILAGASALAGCVEEFEADLPASDTDLLVVEGTICSSQQNEFVLSRALPLNSSQKFVPVKNASVAVRGSDGSEYVAQLSDASYTCYVAELAADATYYLHIEVDGEVYESVPQKPLPTEKIADVCGVQYDGVSDIDVLVTPDAPIEPGRTNYYSWRCDETWEVRPRYRTSIYYNIETKTVEMKENQFPERGWKDATGAATMVGASSSYEGQHIQKLKLYGIGWDNERVRYRYSGLVQQRAITKAEYEYELARRQAGSDMGGLFAPQPSALPTNIHCLTSQKRVIGFVGCSMNTSRYRFFLNASDFSIARQPAIDTRKWMRNPSAATCLELVKTGYFLCEWEDATMSSDGSLWTAWATRSQLDVRYYGAYTEAPDFWSLQENVSY